MGPTLLSCRWPVLRACTVLLMTRAAADGGTKPAAPYNGRSPSTLPDVLLGFRKGDRWACSACHRASNWPNRVRCACGKLAPAKHIQWAVAQANSTGSAGRAEGGRRGGGAGNGRSGSEPKLARLEAELKELKSLLQQGNKDKDKNHKPPVAEAAAAAAAPADPSATVAADVQASPQGDGDRQDECKMYLQKIQSLEHILTLDLDSEHRAFVEKNLAEQRSAYEANRPAKSHFFACERKVKQTAKKLSEVDEQLAAAREEQQSVAANIAKLEGEKAVLAAKHDQPRTDLAKAAQAMAKGDTGDEEVEDFQSPVPVVVPEDVLAIPEFKALQGNDAFKQFWATLRVPAPVGGLPASKAAAGPPAGGVAGGMDVDLDEAKIEQELDVGGGFADLATLVSDKRALAEKLAELGRAKKVRFSPYG